MPVIYTQIRHSKHNSKFTSYIWHSFGPQLSVQTLGTKHSSQPSTVLLVEVTPAWSTFSESFLVAEMSCWQERSNFCIIIVPGGLCSGDNRTVANASHSCSPGYRSLKAHTAIGWSSLLLANPLNPELFSLETSFSLYVPLTHRISFLSKFWLQSWT